MILRALVIAALLPGGVLAQDFGLTPPPVDGQGLDLGPQIVPRFDERPRETVRDTTVVAREAAVLRGLDKISGAVTDLTVGVGEHAAFGRLDILVEACRVPEDDPAGDAFAFLTIRAQGLDRPAFEGWMIASSPALSALDHPRYDVWVMRCTSS